MGITKTFLAIGIAIVFAVFIGYGLIIVYEPPKTLYNYSDCYAKFNCQNYFTPCQKPASPIETPNQNCNTNAPNSPEYKNCLDQQAKCEKDFQRKSPQYTYYRNSFFILTFVGIAAIVGGLLLTVEIISSGLIGGGILVIFFSLIYTAQYWLAFSKYVGLSALGIVLVILVYFSYRKTAKKNLPADQ